MKSDSEIVLRRRELIAGLGALVLPLTAYSSLAAPMQSVTPKQTEGPFYPIKWLGDTDWDLVRVKGEAAQAMGTVTYISGQISDTTGKLLKQLTVEIWQCDINGRYRHPRDGRQTKPDLLFQGRGRVVTDDQGHYRFRTIRPVSYPGRTPHIHFAVSAPSGRRLVTQMYVRGEPKNRHDRLLNSIRNSTLRERLLVDLVPADRIETGALAGKFDVILPA